MVALVGALGNYVASLRRDEKQREYDRDTRRELWRREDQRVFNEQRIEAYRVFARAVSELSMSQDAPEHFSALVPHLPSGAEAQVQLLRAYSDVYTFSSRPVQHAAHELLGVILTSEDERETSLADSRYAFVLEAGRELGVRIEAPDALPEPRSDLPESRE